MIFLASYFLFTEDQESHDFNPTMWHIASVIITVLCIVGYVTLVLYA